MICANDEFVSENISLEFNTRNILSRECSVHIDKIEKNNFTWRIY